MWKGIGWAKNKYRGKEIFMRRIKTTLFIFVLLMTTIFLTACGGKLSTKLELDEDFSGKRIMTYSIEKSTFKDYVNTSFEEITKLLEETNPGALSIEAKEGESSYIYQFVLDFSSKEDYEEKVRKLLGEQDESKEYVFFEVPTSPFVKGLYYEEKFYSRDLLKWMEEAVVDAGYVDQTNVSSIFSDTNVNQLVFGGKTMDSDSYDARIYINNLENNPIRTIDFVTKLNPDATVDRQIILQIPLSTMNAAREEIKSFLESRVADGAEFEWKKDGATETFILSIENAETEKIKEMTHRFTNREESLFLYEDGSVSKSTDASQAVDASTDSDVEEAEQEHEAADATAEKEPKNVFYFDRTVHETINLADYIYHDSSATQFNYYLDEESPIKDERYRLNDTPLMLYMNDTESAYDGYIRLFGISTPIADVSYDIFKGFTLQSVDMVVDIGYDASYTRTIQLVYSDDISDFEFENIKQKIEEQSAGTPIKLSRMEKNESGFSVDLIVTVESGEEEAAWNYFMLLTPRIEATLVNKKSTLFEQEASFQDQFDLLVFTQDVIETVNYRINSLGKMVFHGSEAWSEFVLTNPSATNELVGYYKDFDPTDDQISIALDFARVKRLNVSLAVISGLVLVAAVLLFVIKKRKTQKLLPEVIVESTVVTNDSRAKGKDDLPKATGVEQRAETVSNEVENSPGSDRQSEQFCTECGTKCPADDRFCSSCGKEL